MDNCFKINFRQYRVKSLIMLLLIALIACEKEEEGVQLAEITTINPTSGGLNTVVSISGNGFNENIDNILVKFNGVEAVVERAFPSKLTVVVPKKAGTGPVTITIGDKILVGPQFEYLLSPVISTVAGNGIGNNKDGAALDAELDSPSDIEVDSKGNIYIVSGYRIRMLSTEGMVSTILDETGSGFRNVQEISIDPQDNIYISSEQKIFKYHTDKTTTLVADGFSYKDGNNHYPSFDVIQVGQENQLFAIDSQGNRVYTISSSGEIELFAGSFEGTSGTLDGDKSQALFDQPRDMTIDDEGNLFIVDFGNRTIRKIDTNGVVSTHSGNGTCGREDGSIQEASYCVPIGICSDSYGNLYVTETLNPKIRMISPEGMVKTLAGTGATGYVDGIASEAQFRTPSKIAVEKDSTLLIADSWDNRIRRLSYE